MTLEWSDWRLSVRVERLKGLQVNDTPIALILKVESPSRPIDFKPISVCNVLYKIITKTMTNRMREILGDVIFEEQNAFLPGRLITDNALLGFECMNAFKRHYEFFGGNLSIELDMAKAYVDIEWSFLCTIMAKLGFHDDWRNSGVCSPLRGLRLGNPMELMLEGAHWQIGSGENASVYIDKWVPRGDGLQISSPKVFPLHSNVCDLMKPDGGWNFSLVRKSFLPHEVEAILVIPLSVNMRNNTLVWHHNVNGWYIVKSGY
ncbi:uncharacterized protein LOC133779825 [Humulus lupulus]|uniref:uncharacterized protein LOC133779825 n=1 Tax=Humulus lupulus TaxID=3486 RepID=UPI002B418613|nr:uncharacterized protein LOC133779825 [Humulus lupulus]